MQKARAETRAFSDQNINYLRSFSRALSINADEFAFLALVLEFNKAFDQRKKRVVFAATNIFAGLPLCSALTRQNIAAEYMLAAEFLKAESLRV